jgi:hypothetical protein
VSREPVTMLEVLATARITAKRHGYALTAHGSFARDVDLVAVPWTVEAADAETLVEAIRAAIGGWIMVAEATGREGYFAIDDSTKHSPVERPHGRRAWSIYGVLQGGSYLDLSVMPLREALAAAQEGDPT